MFLPTVIFILTSSAPGHSLLWGCPYKPCGPNEFHTMCMYPSGINFLGPWCMGYGAQSKEMTDEMRKCALDTHNTLRQKVANGQVEPNQPPAANMMKLKYNMEAERIIQHWLNSCQGFKHDHCRDLVDGTPCGQNLFYVGGSSDNQSELAEKVCVSQMEAYFSEVQYLEGRTREQVETFESKEGTGHYTAMIWATVTEVGCAWALGANFHSNWESTGRPLYAGCNYVGGPNLIGGSNYIVGDNCTQCPEGTHCSKRYPGLCTEEIDEDEYVLSRLSLPLPASTLSLFCIGAFVVLFVM